VTQAGGLSGNYITIKAHSGETAIVSSAINGGFKINHAYIKINGFLIEGATNDTGYIFLNRGTASRADYAYISNNTIQDTISTNAWGIYLKEAVAATPSPSNVTITGNILNRLAYNCIGIFGGSYHIISSNIMIGKNNAATYGNDHDGIWLIASNTTVSGNEMYNFDSSASGYHGGDFLQVSGDTGIYQTVATDNIIENNYVHDNKSQIVQLSNDGLSTIHDWTFRNNIFANIGQKMNVYIPNTYIYNNVFYNIENPALIGTNGPVIQCRYRGTPTVSECTGMKVYNNIFFGCAPGSNINGWYYRDASAGAIDADYNYVAKGDFSAKTGFSEPHGINGGDPKFSNIANNDFHLQSTSPAIDTGIALSGFFTDKDGINRPQNSAWDIGAYEYTGSAPPPPADTTPPSAPSGIVVQ
jgi:hypothetical protein